MSYNYAKLSGFFKEVSFTWDRNNPRGAIKLFKETDERILELTKRIADSSTDKKKYDVTNIIIGSSFLSQVKEIKNAFDKKANEKIEKTTNVFKKFFVFIACSLAKRRVANLSNKIESDLKTLNKELEFLISEKK